jgi:hypothetical protein
MNKLLPYILIGALIYMLLQTNVDASAPAGATLATSQAACVNAYAAQFQPGWAQMSVLERAIVGLKMAGCEDGQ